MAPQMASQRTSGAGAPAQYMPGMQAPLMHAPAANGAGMLGAPAATHLAHSGGRSMMLSQQYAGAGGALGGAAPPRAAKTLSRRLSEDTNDSGGMSRTSSKVGKAKKGRSARQRAFEAACPAELRNKLTDADLQGLVVECASVATIAPVATRAPAAADGAHVQEALGA
jgi:hypothetical protein